MTTETYDERPVLSEKPGTLVFTEMLDCPAENTTFFTLDIMTRPMQLKYQVHWFKDTVFNQGIHPSQFDDINFWQQLAAHDMVVYRSVGPFSDVWDFRQGGSSYSEEFASVARGYVQKASATSIYLQFLIQRWVVQWIEWMCQSCGPQEQSDEVMDFAMRNICCHLERIVEMSPVPAGKDPRYYHPHRIAIGINHAMASMLGEMSATAPFESWHKSTSCYNGLLIYGGFRIFHDKLIEDFIRSKPKSTLDFHELAVRHPVLVSGVHDHLGIVRSDVTDLMVFQDTVHAWLEFNMDQSNTPEAGPPQFIPPQRMEN